MSHGGRRTMHRPEDIIPENAPPLLKGQRTEKVKREWHGRLAVPLQRQTQRPGR